MASRKPHLFECLTREEFQLCWALRMTLGFESYEDAYPLGDYRTPGTPDEAETYEEEVRRSIRFLALEHGYPFVGIEAHDDATLYCRPIEPRNMAYARAIALGHFPHPYRAIDTALAELERHCPGLSVDPLLQLRRELKITVDSLPEPDPGSVTEYEADKAAALAAIGIELRPRGRTVH